MKFYFFSILVAFYFFAVATIAHATSETARFLNRFSRIAIGFSEAPGYGHQATGVHILKQLRTMGFTGDFDLYIDDRVRTKIATLLPEYSPHGNAEQELKKIRASTHSLNRTPKQKLPVKSKPEIHKIGFVGGDDRYLTPDELNVDALIVVQPNQWRKAPELRINYENGVVSIPINSAAKLNFNYDLPTFPESIDQFLEEHLKHSIHQAKASGLKWLLANWRQHETQTLYGFDYGSYDINQNLLQLAEAAKLLPSKRGTLLLMLSDWHELEWPELPAAIEVIEITDSKLKEKIEKLAAHQTLIINIGPVPEAIFHTLLVHSSIPPTLAGAGATELMLAAGKPFVITTRDLFTFYNDRNLANILHLPSVKQASSLIQFYLNAKDLSSATVKAALEQQTEHLKRPDKLNTVIAESNKIICNDALIPFHPETSAPSAKPRTSLSTLFSQTVRLFLSF